MTRDIEEELSETDEDELSDETAVEERSEAEDTEENQNQSGTPCEPTSVWSGPTTRSRLRAQEEMLQEIAKIVGLGSRQGDQNKPAWFSVDFFKTWGRQLCFLNFQSKNYSVNFVVLSLAFSVQLKNIDLT
ncbi:hypothetical protein F2Q69_00027649 [Brassica cretica]|uniref:Uncharacterized protein n=1 Tax=Brassica cretica TaxID=69181 RepID=A0A8S9S7L9_BRACR|nr:hypothetical protein F2Q69_00027649 [Brassica cretica]